MDPSSAFDLLEVQTGRSTTSNRVGVIAVVAFAVLVVIVLLALQQTADPHQLLFAGVALALANVVGAVIWRGVGAENAPVPTDRPESDLAHR